MNFSGWKILRAQFYEASFDSMEHFAVRERIHEYP